MTSRRERFLEAILDSATDYGIIAMDLHGQVTTWNEGARRIFGWSEEEMLGKPAGLFFTPEDRRNGIPEAEMRTAIQHGRGNDERWHLRKDGTTFWASGEMMPLRDESGAIEGLIKILRDRTAERQAAERHRADSEFMRGVLAASGDCIKVLDLDARLLFMSEGGQRLMEVGDFNAIRGCPWPDLWAGQGWGDAQAAVESAKNGGTGRFQAEADTLAGNPRLWDVQVTPILGANGRPERLLSVSRDITATRAAEASLAAAEGLNTLILKSSQDCVVVLDLDGRTLFVSPGGIESMEISDLGIVLGQSWLRVWMGADNDAACQAVAAARAGGVGRFQGFCATHKGTPKWWDVVISPLPGLDGKPERLVSVGRDITETRKAQERLERSEERLNLALGASGMVGIWDWDLTTQVVYADANFARIYSVDPDLAARGAPLAEFTRNLHPDDVAAFDGAFSRLLAGSDEFSCEYRVVQPNGSARWILTRGRLVRDGNGVPLRFPSTSVDITERKLAEERQALLMQELAHRVKNTLAVVQAIASQTLKGDGSLTQARDALTARLLALAQAHDVLLQGSWTEARMRALVDSATQLHGHGQSRRFRIDGPEVTLGPKAALSFALVLHELGTNAAKYGALSVPDGHVVVSWRLDTLDETQLRFRWQEVDGPQVAVPTRQGFGSRLIQRSLAQALGAVVHLAYPPDGVTLTMDAPLSALQMT